MSVLTLSAVIGLGLLLIALLALRILAKSARYRARCQDCHYTYGSSDMVKVKAAALFHNLHTREKGEGHQVVIEQRG